MAKRQYRICDRCRKPYWRSNRLRLWVLNNFGHRAGWYKEEQRICCHCLKAQEAQEQLRLINPKWRPTKAQERIAAVNIPKPTEGDKQ